MGKKKRITKKEKLKRAKKKYIILTILSIIISLLLLIGSIYIFKNIDKVNIGTKNTISGDLILKQDNKTKKGIILRGAIPMTVKEGKRQTAYKFAIINVGKTDNQYKVYLKDGKIRNDELRMKEKNIKYRLIEDNQKEEVNLISNLKKDNQKLLVSGKLKPNEKKTYQLQVWLDIDAESFDEDAVFFAKLKIETIKLIN